MARRKKQQLKVYTVSISDIEPHPKNSRLHDDDNIKAIMRSLEAFGQRTPIVLGCDNYIIKGCGTWLSAQRLGWKTIQIVKADLSPEEEIAYAIADNKTSDMSDFDYDVLAESLQELDDMEVTGFQEYELEPLLDPEDFSGSGDDGETEPVLSITFTGEDVDLIEKISEKYQMTPKATILKLIKGK